MITAYASEAWAAIALAMANHLWQSTLFAVLVALLARSLKQNQARVRYGLWLAASVKFLIPFSLLVSAGSHLGWPAASSSRVQLSLAAQQVSRPFVIENSFASAAPAPPFGSTGNLLPALLLMAWLCGAACILFLWCVRWRRMQRTVRAAAPLGEGSERETVTRLQRLMRIRKSVELAAAETSLEPGIFGIFRPVLLLPSGIAEHLSAVQLDAVLAHELCHVRRRDNLAAAMHMLVEAIFWFHPLVWWLGARLVEEREHACDEEVLRLGSEPEVYAESILKTCQFYLESPLACVPGITGSDLKARIVRIMTQGIARKLSLSRKALLAVAAIAAVAGPILFGVLNPLHVRAQSPTATTASAPKFEVASIKPTDGAGGLFRVRLDPSGRFVANNVTVRFLIEQAYSLKDSQISGAPGWIDSEHYDISAKPEDAFVEQKLSRDERSQQISLMLQSLLADRFKVSLHHETKDLPLYVLAVAKNGPKLHESAPAPPESDTPPPGPPGAPLRRGFIQMRSGEFTGNSVSLDRLVEVLSRVVGRIVVDKTGLKGNYYFTLNWTPGEGEGPMFRGPGGPGAGGPPRDAAPPPDASGPTIFTALQEQLGLKLESQKGPVDTVVIDRVEKPSEN